MKKERYVAILNNLRGYEVAGRSGDADKDGTWPTYHTYPPTSPLPSFFKTGFFTTEVKEKCQRPASKQI